jgi:16S rRNA (guanine1207-N2)-methyltransferase
VEGPFRAVVSNPPTHAGDGVTSELFEAAHDELGAGGELWLVYNETLRYEDELARRFDSVDVVRRVEGYAITCARR